MTDKPIEFFKNNKEFQKCAREWQHRLFLDDWFIKFELVEEELYEDETTKEKSLCGYCDRIWENKEAIIKISHLPNITGTVTKNIEELTLIHELLHCLLFPLEPNPDNAHLPDLFMHLDNHIKIEQLAKSLLMAKYNLDYNYFYSEKE